MATVVAELLRGKRKVNFVPHLDNGDYVVVINCDKFHVTGNKMEDKMYYKHSGFLGGLKTTPLNKLLVKKPFRAFEAAVSGMLPKNKLRASMMERMKLFTGDEHTFVAQQPEVIKL